MNKKLTDDPTVMTLDMVASVCGFFSSKSRVNNFYNCTHPKQDDTETDDKTGKEVGRCCYLSCPVATNLQSEPGNDDPDMMRVFDPELLSRINGANAA